MASICIDEKKCIGCSLCVRDCPNHCLYLENNKAHVLPSGCIACGHCYAICPALAVQMTAYPIQDTPTVSMSSLDSQVMLAAMRSRRTIRHFTQEKVSQEAIHSILEAGRYAPTGGNRQNVAFTLLGSKQQEAEAICVKLFRTAKRFGSPFVPFLKQVDITDDFFFKGAPLVIVISSSSEVNGSLAAAYMEIMAESLGLGVLYSGFFSVCCAVSRKLKKLLHLPKGNKVVTAIIIGHPAVKYQRIAPRKPLQATTL